MTRRVDLYASQPHYADHLLPIWRALPAELRGDCWAGDGSSVWGERLPARYRPTDRVMLVGGFQDVQRISFLPSVYVEHGAGQSYVGANHSAYPGGKHPDTVLGYIAPAQRVADQWELARPGVPVGVVGCPRLDPWLAGWRGDPGERTLAITFHWNCGLCPETRTALGHYRRALPALVDRWRTAGWEVLGHGHPRAWPMLEGLWRQLGVEPVESWADVMDRARLLIVDNSSAMYEWAALCRPVVALNAPWYRRHVHHGLRFWNMVPGLQVDEPCQLAALNLDGYVERDAFAVSRAGIAQQVYAHLDGGSARRAAHWLEGIV